MFRGLFIGVDRYLSSSINWLSCAQRDALALQTLFSDNLGGNPQLLTDGLATRNRIESELQSLASCDPEDFVVIAYSGHGTETHQLVTYDADTTDLEGTCISLDRLTELFAKIPARNLVFILDCCFSGGMGAKVLHVDATPRSLTSTESLLDQMSGTGRLILTASSATEEAWESRKIGHGLLTNYLVQALQGPDEVLSAGKLSVYRLLEYVTQRVVADAGSLGHEQHPTLRGRLDGDLTWPVFHPGESYAAAFPERAGKRVTADIHSLAEFGFPDSLIQAWAGSIPALNQLQIDAVNEYGLLNGEHLLVSAPTSSGKTMIGELAALQGALTRKRAVFLFPLKALVSDKLRHFNELYGAFGLRVIRATGDSAADDIVPLMRGHYDICLMTYEKCAALLLGNPFLWDQIGTIVIDEVQMVADPTRGINLEFLLTMLRLRRRQGAEPQVVALSAVIGDTNGFERWLAGRLLRRTERPVPIDEGILRWDGSFRYISSDDGQEKVDHGYIRPELRKGSSQDLIVPLVRRLVGEGKSTIVFRETKGEARGCARYLADTLGLPAAQAALDSLPTGDPSLASNELRRALEAGVGFHIADLDPDERQVVEEQFRRRPSSLKVLAATTTLAMGINTPAEAVVIAGLEHPGNQQYSVAEYKNIAGRAGRLGFSERGRSLLIALSPSEENYLWTRYVLGSPEDLESRFTQAASDARSMILRVLVAAERLSGGMQAEEIVGFLEESFGAFQEKARNPAWKWDERGLYDALGQLERHRLVERNDKNAYRLTELGRLSGVAGIEVESVIRVAGAFIGINPAAINDPSLIAATQLTVELDDVLFPLNKKSTQKEPQMWMGELQRQGIPGSILNAFHDNVTEQHQPTLRAKKSVACLLWITGKPIREMESILTQFGGAFDGAAGPIRGVKSRTSDMLPTVGRIFGLLHPTVAVAERLDRLLLRMELGIPSAAVDLERHAGDRLSRGDYLRLIQAGLETPIALESANDDAILACVEHSKTKLQEIRRCVEQFRRDAQKPVHPQPVLPQYEP